MRWRNFLNFYLKFFFVLRWLKIICFFEKNWWFGLMGVVVYSKFIQNQILLFKQFSRENVYDVFIILALYFIFFGVFFLFSFLYFFKLNLIICFLFRYRISWWVRMNHWRPAKLYCDGPSALRPSTRVSASRISPPRGKTAWLSTPSSIATGAVVFIFFSLLDFSIFSCSLLCCFPLPKEKEKKKNLFLVDGSDLPTIKSITTSSVFKCASIGNGVRDTSTQSHIVAYRHRSSFISRFPTSID